MIRKLFFTCFLIFLCASAFSGSYESVTILNNLVCDFVKKTVTLNADEQLSVEALQKDQWSELPVCSSPIDVALPKNANSQQITAVQLTCVGKNPWNAYIPVAISIQTQVVVAKHTIPAKQIISEDDIELAKMDRNKLLLGFFKNTAEIAGQEAAQVILSGAVLTKNNIRSPVLVHRDEVIDLFVQQGRIRVSLRGVAKEDGRLNSMIKAYNPSSKKLIEVMIVGPHQGQVLS